MWWIKYGCYLDGYNMDDWEWESCPGYGEDDEDIVAEIAWQSGIEHSNGWLGMHGFEPGQVEDFESEEDYAEACEEYVNNYTETDYKWFPDGVDPNEE